MRVNYFKSILEMLHMQLFYIVVFFLVTFTGVNLACLFWKMFTWGLFVFTYGMVALSAVAYAGTGLMVRVIENWEERVKRV